MPRSAISLRLPTSTSRPSTVRPDAVAGDRLERRRLARASMPRSRAPVDDRLGQRMLAALLGRGDEPQQLVVSSMPQSATTSVSCGLPSVSVPVLSRTTAWTRETPSSVAASLIRMLCRAPMPGADRDRRRRRQAERVRAGDHDGRDGEGQRRDGRLAADEVPDDEGDEPGADRQDHQVLRRPVGQPLARAPSSSAPARPARRSGASAVSAPILRGAEA